MSDITRSSGTESAGVADEILTIPELAAKLKFSPDTLYRYVQRALITCDDGLIPHSRIIRIYWPVFLKRYLAGECGCQTTSKKRAR